MVLVSPGEGAVLIAVVAMLGAKGAVAVTRLALSREHGYCLAL